MRWGCALVAQVCVLRQWVAVRALIVCCLAVPLLAAGSAAAQSFFETLFGLGHGGSASRMTGPSRPIVVRPVLSVAERDGADEQRASRASGNAGRSGQTVQTMCVRTCDGYYWPVRYPASGRDLDQDAKICASSCGAQAKLYTRAGPGVEPEEMRDSDGNSYGSTRTAFAYRKGLVNGCACRGMPWSEAERARHEGYALAEAEKAIRLAQAGAEKAAAAAAEAQRIAEDKRHQQLMAQVAAAEAAHAAEAGMAAKAGPAMGPAEAAAVARFGLAAADVTIAGDPGVDMAEDLPRGKGRKVVKRERNRHGGREARTAGVSQRARLPRGPQASQIRIAPQYAASAPKVPWWAQ